MPHRAHPDSDESLRHRALVELAALDKSDFAPFVRRVLATDSSVMGVERVNCWSHDPEASEIRCVAGFVAATAAFEEGMVLRAEDYPRYFEALEEDPIILAHDARSDPRTSEFAQGYLVDKGIASMMDVPIWVRGKLWGVLCHEHVGSPRVWTAAERNFALSIGHILSMAVEAQERADAERSAQLSELFMGILGHDLRNPLTTIRASAQFLAARAPDEVAERASRRIVTSADRMNRMIEQLLDFTRVRLGTGLLVRRDPADLAELCRRVALDVAETRPERVTDVHVHGDASGTWDADRLLQLLWNLVGNAFEHGAKPEMVRLEVDGAAPDEVILRVINRGTVPEAVAAEIFEPFRQSARASPTRGLGLGLFIAREIARAHGGSIRFECLADETVFTVKLPRRPPA